MLLRDRIKEFRRVASSEIRPSPRNWRTHPQGQRDALRGILAEVGIADANLVRELPDGSYELIDGHLRTEEYGPDNPVPVLVLDVTGEEADKLLATMDPLAAMAEADERKVNELLAGLEFESRVVDELAAQVAAQAAEPFRVEYAAVENLKPHPRNYREHPPDQVAHLAASLKQTGFTRPVLVAWDDTILAGHGVVLAARSLGKDMVPVRRLDLGPDDPRALRVLAADNETGGAALVNDRLLAQLLREVSDSAPGRLEGTGFDREKLNALAYVSRPPDEIGSKDPSSEWAGMPEYSNGEKPLQLTVSFRSEADREEFVRSSGLAIDKKEARTWTTWHPPRIRDDLTSVRFEAGV
jgi:ParB-like chromosome segregation protein Spo0J